MKASRIVLVLVVMLAAGLRVSARPTLTTVFEQTYAYDDRTSGGCTTTTAKSAATMLKRASRLNRFGAFHVYDSLRRQLPNTFQQSSGKERDGETGLDYFGARYFSGAQGRFTSPDEWSGGPVDPYTGQQIQQPGPLPYADITNPQSLNKYAYVLNNPLRYTDPDGHCVGALTPYCPQIVAAGERVVAIGDKAVTSALVLGGALLGALASNVPGDQLGTPDTFGGGNPNVFHMSDSTAGSQAQQSQQVNQSTPANPGPEKPRNDLGRTARVKHFETPGMRI